MKSRLSLAALIALAGGIGAAAAMAGPTEAVVPGARFANLPVGWTQISEAPFIVQPDGSIHSQTMAWNWRYRLDSYGPVAHLPRSGIFISILLLRPAGTFHPYPAYRHRLRLPLHLRDATIATEKGMPQVPQYRLFGSTLDYNVDVRIDFGTPHPPPRMIAAAQRVLDRLELPPRTR